MLYIVFIQFIATIVLAIVGGILGGAPGFFSNLSGGACYALPNGIFASYLFLSYKFNKFNEKLFFYAEFAQVTAAIGLMGLTISFYQDLNWLGFITSFCLVIKTYLILLFKH